MPVGYMQGTKKARNTPSISAYHQVGIKAGLAPVIGLNQMNRPAYRFAVNTQNPPDTPAYQSYAAQVAYLYANKLVSVNPQCSGGVGRKQLFLCFNSGPNN